MNEDRDADANMLKTVLHLVKNRKSMLLPRGPDGKVRFNMGCGYNKLPDHINVDASPVCEPDIVFDLETLPWPWEASSADVVLFKHSLEHMGQDPELFLGIIKELYRICKNEAAVHIHVPHPRHDNFLGDPTHVRPITPMVLSLFDKTENDRWKAMGAGNTPLGHYLDVDFRIVDRKDLLEEPYRTLLEEKRIGIEEIEKLAREANNIIAEYRFVLKAVK